MDVQALGRAEREALAADPATDPAVLAELAADFYLVATLATNPSTPEETLRGIYRDFPHLRPARPEQPDDRGPMSEQDAAIEAFRRRRAAAAAGYGRGRGGYAPAARPEQYVQVLDADGQAVRVPLSALGGRGTNGMAVAAFVVALLGGSALAIILGHVAKSQIARTGEGGDGMATGALVIGYLSMAVLVVLVLVALTAG